MNRRRDFEGPALFSHGFRTFFFVAILFALVVVPAWYLAWSGIITLESPFVPTDWHVHEMIFGYGAAVVAGFLFTAVPNWTGRLPTRGWPLAVLLGAWGLGRLSVAGLFGLGPLSVLLIDCAFLLAVAAMIAREIVAGKNWRNLKVLIPVTLLLASNVLFHVEAMSGTADVGRRMGISLLVFLVTLIGGRIIPSFTRNWLVRRSAGKMPAPFGRFDAVCLAIGAIALGAWTMSPGSLSTSALGLAAFVLHALRLFRWRGIAVATDPLLAMLHVAYLFVPVGFLSVSLGSIGLVSQAVPGHVLGIGVIGCMTTAVMMRATMGHTGRELVAGKALSLAFLLLLAALVSRLAAEGFTDRSVPMMVSAGLIWIVAFAMIAWRLTPLLLK